MFVSITFCYRGVGIFVKLSATHLQPYLLVTAGVNCYVYLTFAANLPLVFSCLPTIYFNNLLYIACMSTADIKTRSIHRY